MFDLLLNFRAEIQYSLILLAALIAAFVGAAPERCSSGALLSMAIIDALYHRVFGDAFIVHAIDVSHLAMDLAALAIFFAIALNANRMYPLWLASLQTISVLYHFAREVNPSGAGAAYQLLSISPSYLMLALVYGGIFAHCIRIKRYGPYRSWRWSPPRLIENANEQPTPDLLKDQLSA